MFCLLAAKLPVQARRLLSSTPVALGVALLALVLVAPASAAPGEEKPPFPSGTDIECERPNTVRVGETITCSATVTDTRSKNATAPGGRVNWEHSGQGTFTPEPGCQLLGNGTSDSSSCSVSFRPESAGKMSVGGTYNGADGVHLPSSEIIQLNVKQPLATQTQVSCKPAVLALGASSTCTIVVTDTSATPLLPQGTVLMSGNGAGTFNPKVCTVLTPLGDGRSVSCKTTYTPSAVGAGIHIVTGEYGGDTQGTFSHVDSKGSTSVKVLSGAHQTQTSVACLPASVAVGEAAACKVTVVDTDGEPEVPTGTVAFTHTNQGSFGPTGGCELSSGGDGKTATCTLSYQPTAAGDHQVTATYAGDAAHAGGASSFVLVARHPTKATLTCSPSNVILGGAGACTVTVEDELAVGGAAPKGQVKFTSDGPGGFSSSGSCALFPVGAKQSRCQIVYTPASSGGGPHTLKAAFQGGPAHEPSSGEAQVSVLPPNGGDASATSVDCEPANVFVGGAAICTVDVVDVAAGPTVPTGLVVFASDAAGTFDTPSCLLFRFKSSPNRARCQVVYRPVEVGSGTHDLTAIYPGDAAHEPSQGTNTILVNPANNGHHTTTIVSCLPVSVVAGTSIPCAVTVTDSEGGAATTPHGSVFLGTDKGGAFDPGGCILVGAGDGHSASCAVTYTPTSGGTHGVTGVYSGDATHEPSEGATSISVTGKHLTATSLVCASPRPVGMPSNCVATVLDESETPLPPAGEVKLSSNGSGTFSQPGCTLVPGGDGRTSSCSVSYTPNSRGTGLHKLTAAYQGSTTHESSQGGFDLTVTEEGGGEGEGGTPHATQTTVSCTPSPVEVGHGADCDATVVDAAVTGGTVPSGTVHFQTAAPGAFSPATCALEAKADGHSAGCDAKVKYTPSAKGSGTHSVEATYSADSTHESSEGGFDLTVTDQGGGEGGEDDGHPTQTTIGCEPPSVVLGGGSTCTVRVEDTAADGAAAPGGQVALSSNPAGAFSDPCVLAPVGPAASSCQVVYVPAAAGANAVRAEYGGDATHAGSSAETPLQVTSPDGGHHVDAAVDCEPNPVTIGGAAVCTVTVVDGASGASVPGGLVVFATNGAGSFDTGGCVLFPAGDQAEHRSQCQIIYTPALLGAQKVTALYSGDPSHEPAIATTMLQVSAPSGGHPTATTISCTPSTVTLGGGAECSATVLDTEPPGGATAPKRSVIFFSDSPGTFSPGGCILGGTGDRASCHVTYTPTAVGGGAHRITALYSGDASHEPSKGETAVGVSSPPHASGVSLACAPAPAQVGAAPGTTCTATVTDTGQAPSAPTGAVRFASDGIGGFSTGAACMLGIAGADRAACHVTYAPSALGTGVHRITAVYQGDGDHLQSQGQTELQVVAPPNTRFAKRPRLPRRRSALRRVRFRFNSDQAGSTFECKLDRRRFRRCNNPFRARLRRGRHVFRVRAVNPQGMVDPTPATYRWRLMVPPRRAGLSRR